MKKLFLSTLLLALPLLASAYDAQIDGIYYRLNKLSKTALVTYQVYDNGNYKSDYSGSVVIPEKFNYDGIEYTVTSIGTWAFQDCSGLMSITIPNSVTSIGGSAFKRCSGLTSVTIPNSLPSISGGVFEGCSSLTSVTIPNSVTSIGKFAFKECTSLTSVTIPNSVTNIDAYAFLGCSSLLNVIIPNSVTSIGNGAFADCSGLTSVTFPNSVNNIANHTFSGCSSLTNITIPNTVIAVGDGAFANCSSLTSVTIPNSVTTLGDYAFQGCSGLLNVIIPNSVTSIGISAFALCSSLTSVTIPDLITSIENSTFSSCESLTSVTIPNTVTSIGTNAFLNCTSLTSVIIPNSVTTIGNSAFSVCTSLTSVTIPNSVKSIGKRAFASCKALNSIIVEKGNTQYDSRDNCNAIIESNTNTLIVGCQNTVIPNSVTCIGEYAFSGCNGLTSITIPNSVKSIREYAFQYCLKLQEVYCFAENIPSAEIDAFFLSNHENAILYVPANSLNDYKTTSPWSEFGKILPIGGYEYKLTYMVDGILYLSYTLKEGDLIKPEGVPTKEGYTFSGWSDIPEIMPASDLTIIGTFVPNKYKLTYFVDGGEYKSSEVEFGSTISAEEAPTKEGYTFLGWSEIPSTMPASDVTITGSFSVNKYKLTYTLDGKEYKTTELDYGTALTPEEVPVKEGYTFSGWSDIPETMPASDVTVSGTFTINKYKLTYMVDGEEYKASEVNYGTAITAEAVPTKEGYTFSGWSEIPSTMPASDVTISGTFTINKYKLTYTVDGKVFKSSEVEFGSTITAEDNPTKEGYTFSGWSEIPETMPANDVTITGTFTVNKYKLTYMVDGIEYKFYEVEYGATITPEASPANEGQTFSGWSEIPTTMPAQDVVITGTFSDNSYKLTYMVDGEVFKSSHVEYGSTITPETLPIKEGYTFSGWSEIPETMPASDVTITGTFTINTYTITYMVDNALLTTEEVTYGSTITPPASPKEGYEITWNSHPTTMPAYDVTIYGSYISTGINGIYAEESDKKVYTPDGKRIQSPKKGLNIIRRSDGTIKKVVVK